MLRIKQFLQKIHAEESEIYNKISDIFVAPTEYDRISTILKKKRIVFLTGTRENGKTYTAVRLLWEYFNNGYDPKWFSREQVLDQTFDERTSRFRKILQSRSIVLIDDLFGKTEYERNEGFERNFKTLIDTVTNSEDAYLIVTSREEIFKEFLGITGFDPRDLIIKMNIKNPS